MKIGDKVAYRDEQVLDGLYGEVVEPEHVETDSVRPDYGNPEEYVLVAWADGKRYWEHPDDLVKLEGIS